MLDNILKLSNLFYKLASTWGGLFRGEWWLDEHGQSEYADGDIGDKGHEVIAVDNMVDKDMLIDGLAEKYTQELNSGLIDEDECAYYLNQLEDLKSDEVGASAIIEELDIPDSIGEQATRSPEVWHDLKKDAREAYSKYYGAIRVINNSFCAYKITDKTIEAIKIFLFEQADDLIENTDEEIEIEESSTGNFISIPVKEFLEIKHPGQLWRLKDI
jgi:hypothetical protein